MSAAEAKSTQTNVDDTVRVPIEKRIRIPTLDDRLTEELVIGLVGPVGSGCSITAKCLTKILENEYSYSVDYYKLSDFIAESAKLLGKAIQGPSSGAHRVEQLQAVGDDLRKACGNAYLAAKAIGSIAKKRGDIGNGKADGSNNAEKKIRKAHIVDSIKHPDELKILRSTYGEIFWLIGVFAPMEVRHDRLKYQSGFTNDELNRIIQRDYREEEAHGQNVRDVFYQADLFIRNDQPNEIRLEKTLSRFLEVIFGSPVHTPTQEESSMYAAYAEAAKSACLSRQIGAAIVSEGGELIGVGRNDVPRFGGGLYTEDADEGDNRCHAWRDKVCHNDKKKDALYRQIFDNFRKEGLLAGEVSLQRVVEALKVTGIKQLIEYSRAVHAEMDAIISVARTQKSGLLGSTLYSTTFPCHSCARHIVASGIKKVLFIEPYPKSLATELHSDAVSEKEDNTGTKVAFLQFSGFAPKNILKLFNAGLTRKNSEGKLREFEKKRASPVVKVSLDDYSTHEKLVIAELDSNEKQASEGKQTDFLAPGVHSSS